MDAVRKKNITCPCRDSNLDRSARILVTVVTELPWSLDSHLRPLKQTLSCRRPKWYNCSKTTQSLVTQQISVTLTKKLLRHIWRSFGCGRGQVRTAAFTFADPIPKRPWEIKNLPIKKWFTAFLKPNVTFQWFVLLLRIREVPGSVLNPGTVYPYCGLSQISWVPSWKCFVSHLSFIVQNHLPIPHYTTAIIHNVRGRNLR